MPTLADVRAQYPQYSDMPDEQLASALHSKFYADMPREQFDAKMGLKATTTANPILDVAKQIPSGLAAGLENIPAAPARLADLAARGLSAGLGKLGIGQGLQEAEQKRQQGFSNAGEPASIADYLPQPETVPGEFARTGSSFILPFVAGSRGSAVKSAVVGATSGLASEAAGQTTKGTAAEPYARMGAAALAAPAAMATVRAPGQIIGNIGTGTGERSLATAYRAGLKGGSAGEAFRENVRGTADPASVVADAKSALSQMRQQKNVEYQSGMTGINKDPTVLDFKPIDNALEGVESVKSFKGQALSKSTEGVRNEIRETIDHWRGLDPADYHTPAGFDALKQAIGDIKDSLPYNTPQRLVAERVYNAVRDSIVRQAPGYASVMRNYQLASDEISQVERTLSLGKKATIDTALRKLQSVMRDNVNTNYGKRADLAQALAENGAPNLMEKLAGQANATWVPRGLNKLIAAPLAASAYLNPMHLAALPFMSPRLMAEAAHGAGRVIGGARGLLNFPRLPQDLSLGQQAAILSLLGGEQANR